MPPLDRRAVPRWSLVALVLCLVVGALRIVSTYDVFSETFDEGVHIAAGMELLDKGKFTYEPKHPPLSRLAVAAGPYLSGIRSQGVGNIWGEGRAIIHAGDARRTLFLARLGVLPFFLLAALMVWIWSRRLSGDGAAVVATALFTGTPLVLAHSGLATTDIGLTATLLALTFASTCWLDRPSVGTSVWLGVAGAAALTAKLSSVAFFGLTVVLVLMVRWWWGRGRPVLPGSAGGAAGGQGGHDGTPPGGGIVGRIAALLTITPQHLRLVLFVVAPVAFVSVWCLYRFQVGTLRGVPFPLTTLVQGVRDLVNHNDLGHVSFLLGEAYADGKWMFFPVGLAVKAPLTLLALGLSGFGLLGRRAWRERDWHLAVPLMLAAAVLAVSIPARINIGVRHVLPVFGVLAMVGGMAAAYAWGRWTGRGARAALVLISTVGMWSTARVHPDYLAYFNELGGTHPERILVDSDLDWGQDLWRLADTLKTRGIDSVTMAYFGSAVPAKYGIKGTRNWTRDEPVHGWFVVSQTLKQRGDATLRLRRWTLYPDALDWLNTLKPEAQIGRSLLLYKVP